MMNIKPHRLLSDSARFHDRGDDVRSLAVLVVDDDASAAELLADEVRERGYFADAAYDGAHALSLLAVRRYGVVVSDFAMPVIGGAELLQRVRANPRFDTGFVLLSSHPESVVQQAATGYDAFLRKPVTFDALISLIESVYNDRQRAGVSRRS
jgi:CheY-like chemotaxis protein